MHRPLLLPLAIAGLLAGCETPPYYEYGDGGLPSYSGTYGRGGSDPWYDDGRYYRSRTAELCRIESARVRVDRNTTCDCDSRICYRDGAIDKTDTREAFGDRAADRADDLRDRFSTGRVFLPGDGVVCVFTTQTCYKDGRPDRDETRDFFGEKGGRRHREERRELIRQLNRLRDQDERPQRADDDRRDRERRLGRSVPAKRREKAQERQADRPRDDEPQRRELVREREGHQERSEDHEGVRRQGDRRQERDGEGETSRDQARRTDDTLRKYRPQQQHDESPAAVYRIPERRSEDPPREYRPPQREERRGDDSFGRSSRSERGGPSSGGSGSSDGGRSERREERRESSGGGSDSCSGSKARCGKD